MNAKSSMFELWKDAPETAPSRRTIMSAAARETQRLTSFDDANPRVCLIKLILVLTAATELFFSNAVMLFGRHAWR